MAEHTDFVYIDSPQAGDNAGPYQTKSTSIGFRRPEVTPISSIQANSASGSSAVLGKSLVLDCKLPGEASPPDVQGSVDQKRLCLPQPFEHYVLDHQGPVRLVLQQDGTVAYELSDPQGDNASSKSPAAAFSLKEQTGQFVIKALHVAAVISVSVGGVVGVLTTAAQLHNGDATPNDLFWSVSEAVSSSVAGVLTGAVLGPLVAAKSITSKLIRPVLLGVAIRKLVSICRRGCDIKQLLQHLMSSSLMAKLAALEKIAVEAAQNPRFQEAFKRNGGLALLLHVLYNATDDATIRAAVKAVAALAHDPEFQGLLAGPATVGRLGSLLEHRDPNVVRDATRTLAALARHPQGKTLLRSTGLLDKVLGAPAKAPARA